MSVVANRALPQGYKLHNYRIDRAISRGGFSIVYRAVDDNGTVVAIKEYHNGNQRLMFLAKMP